jgi:trimethylamine--corrinoid protein Co-methyltransferase
MNASPHLGLLGPQDVERLHAATLKVLAEVGIRFQSATARELLRGAGVQVDQESQIAKLPRELVEWAIETAPKTFLLAGRDAGHDCLLDHRHTYTTLDGIGAGVLDHRTGARRPSTSADLAEAVRLADALPELDIQWYIVNPTEQKPKLENLRGIATMLANTGKHVQAEVLHPEDVPFTMELLDLSAAGGRWDRDRPHFSAVYCPVAPLQHDADSLDAALLLAAEGVPQTVYSLALAGATAPITLAGTIVQTNCDVLSGFVILQLAAAGCPLIYVANSAIMDMRSASYACSGPEQMLINAAMSELAKHYGLPFLTGGFSSNAKRISMHSGVDGAPMAFASLMLGCDILTGFGMLDAAQLLYLPKLVLDAEVRRQGDRLMGGIDLDDEHLMLDVIARVGPGGHYLKVKESKRLLRDGEHLSPRLMPRPSYEAWEQDPRSELQRATEIVDELLESHVPPALPDGAAAAMEEVIARADAELPER